MYRYNLLDTVVFSNISAGYGNWPDFGEVHGAEELGDNLARNTPVL